LWRWQAMHHFWWITMIGGSNLIQFKHARQGITFSFLGTLTLNGTILWSWALDAIAFNSSKHYGTPNYWVPKFFIELSGATLYDAKLQTNFSTLVASAITWQNSNGETYLKIKVR
jgi:hypothetical protein